MKPGIRSSELWLGLFGAVLMYLNDFYGWGFDVKTIVGTVAIIVGYIVSRTVVKAKQITKEKEIELEKVKTK
ncbi:MAG: hypothetical protein ACE5HR_00035 [bacterium]